MSRLNDIRIYWNNIGCYRFYDDKMWKGKIILNEDGWFEGIVDENENKKFVFGVYEPGKVIELTEIPTQEDYHAVIFRCKRDAKGYTGKAFLKDEIGEERQVKSSYIITRDVKELLEEGFTEVKGRNPEQETLELLNKLKKLKDSLKDSIYYKELYEELFKIRENYLESVLEQNDIGSFKKTRTMTFSLAQTKK